MVRLNYSGPIVNLMRLTIALFLVSLPAFAESPLTVVLFQSWHDPKEGAFTVNVPQGWRIFGGVSRRAAVDIRHVVRAEDPTGRIRIFLDDPDIVPRQVPDAMMTSMGLREGQTMQAAWGAPILLQRYRPGADYSRDYTKTRLCSTPEFTGGGELTAETADVTREAAAMAASGKSARVRRPAMPISAVRRTMAMSIRPRFSRDRGWVGAR
jgi:hypothetical protein